MSKINKVVLAYSGGLDTSVILKWLQDKYDCEVVTFTADLGQGEEVEPARAKAQSLGIKEIYIEDLREEFARDYVFPMFRANAIYEGEYLLGTSIARPLIAKRLVEIAQQTGAEAVSHGATGKGNDQVRFELGAYALNPNIKVIAPWREWDLLSRQKLLDYAEQHGIPVEMKQGKKSPYSMDANLLHISYEGGILEDPWAEPEETMWRWSVSPENAPDKATYLELTYEKGDITAINGEAMSPATVMTYLNKVAGENGIGRLDIVENRYVGMKSRGCYETPAGTVMLKAHRAIESLTLDREVAHLKDELMPRYAKLIYNGYWWAPERVMLQKMIDESQTTVNGKVRVKLYKGSVSVVGRASETDSLFDESIATFEDDAGAYDQKDAEGFIKLNALRLKIAGKAKRKF
ncbi:MULTISPECIES: argininosuccinate synthase [unclassified Methylophaga]|jgi:argininosuccinate synthase|uniref:argininosuccinate synthase n=1 Tax=unclassified Methylophaga TaxID=2629249 RepID=UPI00259CA951|nr:MULTISPECIES: argininosuccinate synthase [unclassified Methylophaga]|tara:strand:- start:2414 stop:3631 length:1218 start_codon:yes stop_codon:yes gene_type:complete